MNSKTFDRVDELTKMAAMNCASAYSAHSLSAHDYQILLDQQLALVKATLKADGISGAHMLANDAFHYHLARLNAI